jgi:hypothetical protein
MNKWLKGIIFFVFCVLVAGLVLFTLDKLIDQTYWEQVSEMDAPDGAFTLYEYNYFSDGDRHAPYGTYIFIKPGYSKLKPIDSHVIFAGYCSNNNLYQWVGSKEIKITCIGSEKDSVKTQALKAYGINIYVNNETAKASE